jgi:hypothetical protein
MDSCTVTCPYCGEDVEIAFEPDVHGVLIQDCEVCCQPWRIQIRRDRTGDPTVDVWRADGSDA